MTIPTLRLTIAPIAALLLAACATPQAEAPASHDYPTLERVRYVQECMVEHPGAPYEMMSKCSCALDAMMKELSTDDFVELSTAAKATTIGGERGGVLRESAQHQREARRWRDLQRKVKTGCFIPTAPR